MRGARRKGTRYFGPYAHAYAIRETLDLLLRSFPIRTCSDAKFRRHERLGRPCLLYHIERCAGPCIGAVDEATYGGYVEGADGLPRGRHQAGRGPPRARDAARPPTALEFELAARLRDRLASVRLAIERQEMVVATRRGLRRRRDRRGRARGRRAGAPRAPRPRRRPARLHPREGRGRSTAPELVGTRARAAVRRDPDRRSPRGARPRGCPTTPETYAEWLARAPAAARVAIQGAAAGAQARPARGGPRERRRAAHAPPACGARAT